MLSSFRSLFANKSPSQDTTWSPEAPTVKEADWRFLSNPNNPLINALNEELHCSICLELFDRPVFLDCRHTLCQHHISELLAQQENTKGLLCPLCRHKTPSEKLKSLKSDSLRERLIAGMKKARLDDASVDSCPITIPERPSIADHTPSSPPKSAALSDNAASSFSESLSALLKPQQIEGNAQKNLRLLKNSVERSIDSCFETLMKGLSLEREQLLNQTRTAVEYEMSKYANNKESLSCAPTLVRSLEEDSPQLQECQRAIMDSFLNGLGRIQEISPHALSTPTLSPRQQQTQTIAVPEPPPNMIHEEEAPPDGIYAADRSVPGVELSTSWCYAGTGDAIGFTVSCPIELHGLGLFGGQGQYDCRISLRRGYKEITSTCLQYTNNDTTLTKAYFSSPILLEPNVVYNVVALIAGWGSFYCKGYSSTLVVTGRAPGNSSRQRAQFTFVDAMPPTNGTNVDGGQIPALLFKFVG